MRESCKIEFKGMREDHKTRTFFYDVLFPINIQVDILFPNYEKKYIREVKKKDKIY